MHTYQSTFVAIALIAASWPAAVHADSSTFGTLAAFAKNVSAVRTYADEEGQKLVGKVSPKDFALPKPILKRSDFDFALIEHGGRKLWVDQIQFHVSDQKVKIVSGGGPDISRSGVQTSATRGMGED
jgi:hypothetical protein